MKDIQEYETAYAIDRHGNVYSKRSGKILKQHINVQTGYLTVSLWKNNKGSTKTIHRLLALAYIPNPLGLPQVNHIDGNKLNNTLSNLEWVSCKDNIQHALQTGLSTPIEKKLSEDKYVEILHKFLNGDTLTALALSYNVGLSKLSIHIASTAKTLGLTSKYIEELTRQKRVRNIEANNSRKRKVAQYSLNDEYIRTFESLNDATKFLQKKSSGPISNVLYNRTHTAYGYKWKFL